MLTCDTLRRLLHRASSSREGWKDLEALRLHAAHAETEKRGSWVGGQQA